MLRTSRTEERMIRASPPASARPSVRLGRTIDAGELAPLVGNHLVSTARKRTKTMPTTNDGIAYVPIETGYAILSHMEPGLKPATRPRGMPIAADHRYPAAASSLGYGSRENIRTETGTPVTEVPRLRVKKPASVLKYWTYSGLLNP